MIDIAIFKIGFKHLGFCLEKFGVLEFPENHNLVLKLREFRRQIRFVLRESS